MTETALIRQILEYCNYKNLLFYRTQSGAIRTERGGLFKAGTPGCPDLTGCVDGRFVGVECKVGKNKQSDLQKRFEKLILEARGEYWLVYSLDEFIEKLKIYGR